jgi:hypothetical protein
MVLSTCPLLLHCPCCAPQPHVNAMFLIQSWEHRMNQPSQAVVDLQHGTTNALKLFGLCDILRMHTMYGRAASRQEQQSCSNHNIMAWLRLLSASCRMSGTANQGRVMVMPNNSTNQKHRQHWRGHSHQDGNTRSPDTVTTVYLHKAKPHPGGARSHSSLGKKRHGDRDTGTSAKDRMLTTHN